LFYRIIAGLWILIIGGILQIFIQNTVFEIVLSLGGALLFSLFIIFDTQVNKAYKFTYTVDITLIITSMQRLIMKFRPFSSPPKKWLKLHKR
jgi:FtsH-binding integral membrane protein